METAIQGAAGKRLASFFDYCAGDSVSDAADLRLMLTVRAGKLMGPMAAIMIWRALFRQHC